jgi:citrate lyase subunit beta/citryl-CoA lyase
VSDARTVGSDGERDGRVTATPGGKLSVVVVVENRELLERGIREVAEETLAALKVKSGTYRVEDNGALDFVIAARLEVAARAVDLKVAPLSPKVVDRPAAERDRPRRSRLYAPGNTPRFLLGIELYGEDAVLLDLEDAVPPFEKEAARTLVKHLLAAVDLPEAWVRVNPLDLGGKDDLAEVLRGRPNGICLPKAEGARDVQALSALLAKLEKELGIPVGSTLVMPILETAKGVLHAEEIAGSDPRVAVLAFGAEDYTRDVGARRTTEALLFARSMVVAGAKASGVQASDTVYANVDDEAGLVCESKLARDLGFDGKGAINPRQIAPIHSVFSPSPAEVEEARKVVAAAEEAEARGVGAITVGGKMVDRPVLERARRTLRLADRLSLEGRR